MNTKTTKFLAVLAVIAMAFAAFAIIAPAETEDAAVHTSVGEKDSVITGDANKTGGAVAPTTTNLVLDSSTAFTMTSAAFSAAQSIVYLTSGSTLTVTSGSASHGTTPVAFACAYLSGTSYKVTTGTGIAFNANQTPAADLTITNDNGVLKITSATLLTTTEISVIGTDATSILMVKSGTNTAITGNTSIGLANTTTEYAEAYPVTQANSEATLTLTIAAPVVFTGGVNITSASTQATGNAVTIDTNAYTTGKISNGSSTYITVQNWMGDIVKAAGTGTGLTVAAPTAGAMTAKAGSVTLSAYAAAQLTLTGDIDFNKIQNSTTAVAGIATTANYKASGTLVMDGTKVTFDSFIGTLSDKDTLAVLTSGSITLDEGSFDLNDGTADSSFVIGGGAKECILTVGRNAVLATAEAGTPSTVKIHDYASLIVYGTLNNGATTTLVDFNTHGVSVTSENYGKFSAYSGAVLGQKVYIKMDADHVSVGSAMKDVEITTELTSDQTYNQIQNVVITKDLVIRPGVTVAILGKLTVNSGVTLTVSDTATLILGGISYNDTTYPSYIATADIQGTLEVKKNTGTNNGLYLRYGNGFNVTGSMDVDGPISIGAKTVFKSGSTFNLSDDGTLVMTGNNLLYINKGAVATIEGSWNPTSSYAMNVAGTVKIDGSITNVAADAVVNLQADDATAEISNVNFLNAGSNLVIKDTGTKLYKADGTTALTVGTLNTLTIDPNAASIFSGMKVEQTAFVYEDELYSTLDISGSLSNSTTDAIAVEIATTASEHYYGGFTVSETLTVGENVTFTNDTDGTYFLISGEMYSAFSSAVVTLSAVKEAGSTVPTTTVTGVLDVVLKSAENKINAAYYEQTVTGVKHYIYTSLGNALQYGPDEFKVLGTIEIDENLDIASPKKIDASNGANIIIGSTDDRTVTLTVKDGAKLTLGTATVYGSLVYEDYTTGKKVGTIVSDVYVTSGKVQKFTNLYTAVAGADQGDVVTVTKEDGAVVLDKSLTIPELVAVEVPAGYGLYMNDGVILTIDGSLMVWDAIQHASSTVFVQKSVLATSGEIKMIVNGSFSSVASVSYTGGTNNYNTPGAYYNYTTDEATFKCISPLSVAALLTDTSGMGAITLNGVQSVGSVAIGGTDYATTITLGADAEVTAGTLTIANTKIDATNGVVFSGTIASEEGAVKFAYATGFTVWDKKVSGEYQTQLIGTAITYQTGKASSFSVSVTEGTVYATGSVVVSSISIAEDAILVITGSTNSLTNSATTTVNGSLIVNDGGRFTNSSTTKGVSVLGSLTVMDADSEEGTAAGIASIKELAIGQKMGDFRSTSDAAAVLATEIGDLVTVYVLAGSSITEDVVEDMIASKFVVEDFEYATVYTLATSTLKAGAIYPPEIEDAKFKNWTYVSSGETKDATDVKLTTARTYTALINYEIYTITITTDAGIKGVSIDGIDMVWNGANQFTTLNNIEAGTHKVTYTLKSGYEEDTNGVNLYTENGTVLKSKEFITSGTDYTAVKLLLNGTKQIDTPEPEPTPEPEKKSEWTITTILLVVLVILIAIMAVIVALRLNRS